MKCRERAVRDYGTGSLSSWRAWIEMFSASNTSMPIARSLSSWRAWIEIGGLPLDGYARRRSPHGERGLKCRAAACGGVAAVSLSSWRAWIEIRSPPSRELGRRKSLSSWRAWIEMMARNPVTGRHWSLSSWRAWIEIQTTTYQELCEKVALLMESVD